MYSTSAYAVFTVYAVAAVLCIVCSFYEYFSDFSSYIFSFIQILMSVHLVLIIIAHRSVLIMMVGSVAAVMKDIDWGMIGSAVKVRERERGNSVRNLTIFSLDIDECAEMTDDCEQICTNTLGGYQCSCLSGWNLRNRNSCTPAGQFHY